jgi:hypothetical protein
VSFWSAPIAGLVAVWLWLVFSYGGYIPVHWLPAGLALGLFGIVAALLGAYPRRPGQLSLTLLALFGAYAVWVAVSALWAESATRVWMESARTFVYLLVVVLALIYFTEASARRTFRYLVVAASLAVLVVCIVKLWSAGDVASLFQEKRFSYPASAPNHVGALVLVCFWPLMWLASASTERAPLRGLALGIATGSLGLAVMTQSRGAIWSLGVSLVLMFIISPARLRLLFYLVAPGLLMVYEFPTLNRYWVEGPTAVGGGVGARTLLVATLTAAFIGMILALLERWVKVTLRMKAIFGTVIMVAVLGGAVYWGVTATSDAGGPVKWASQTWQQFTGENTRDPAAEGASRFALVSSTGRVQIWKVAIQVFKDAPVLGVGADNFVFRYDLLRLSESFKPQQAHSLELQVLGETGLVGGVLFFGAIVLALGAWLWPRCTAGWRAARATWFGKAKPGPEQTGRPSLRTGASTRWCNPRWGDDPAAYGWEMALLAGAGYWLVHASVDWIWQMTGVTIPALLFVAAAMASVDAKAGVLWPRLRRWTSLGSAPMSTQEVPAEVVAAPSPVRMADDDDFWRAPAVKPGPPPVPTLRPGPPPLPGAVAAPRTVPAGDRAGGARAERGARARNQGLLTHVFRAGVVALAAVVLVTTGLPYLSAKYQDSALAAAETDGLKAAHRAAAARYLLPTDPGPYLTQARIYERAAVRTLDERGPGAAGAVLDNLALAVGSYENAIALEAADWTTHYHAGVAMLNLLMARGYIEGWESVQISEPTVSVQNVLGDWSSLAALDGEPASPGLTPGSLAQDETTRMGAARLRAMTDVQLAAQTLAFLRAADERNPLASQVDDAITLAGQLTPPAGK